MTAFLVSAVITAPFVWAVHRYLRQLAQWAFDQGFDAGTEYGFRQGHACEQFNHYAPGEIKDGRMMLDLNDRRGGMN